MYFFITVPVASKLKRLSPVQDDIDPTAGSSKRLEQRSVCYWQDGATNVRHR